MCFSTEDGYQEDSMTSDFHPESRHQISQEVDNKMADITETEVDTECRKEEAVMYNEDKKRKSEEILLKNFVIDTSVDETENGVDVVFKEIEWGTQK